MKIQQKKRSRLCAHKKTGKEHNAPPSPQKARRPPEKNAPPSPAKARRTIFREKKEGPEKGESPPPSLVTHHVKTAASGFFAEETDGCLRNTLECSVEAPG